ncbi:MAG TPA: DEAD/DEAH box helicase [Candidatus Lokiarchaeia archaeon]|nr:DEAD/DEAH box helicase [Candidatus Lokiarchaeia archaeon]
MVVGALRNNNSVCRVVFPGDEEFVTISGVTYFKIKPLAAQHQRTFQEITVIDPATLVLFTGSTPARSRVALWAQARVAFITPQVLRNDVDRGRYSMENVVLLVVDEAHHAVGKYAYTSVIDMYRSQAGDPRVLGITASPGGTKEKIEVVARNLGFSKIEVRTDSSPDFNLY